MQGIRVTSLEAFHRCAYKRKNDVYDIDPGATYKGDVLNVAAVSEGDFMPFVNFYVDTYGKDIKEKTNLTSACTIAREKIKGLKDMYPQFYQETALKYVYNDEYYIEGTPDMFFFDGEIWNVRDLKMSTWSRYANKDTQEFSMQKYIYPLMVMNLMKAKECTFTYWVFDKGKGVDKFIPDIQVITRDEAKARLDMVMEAYITAGFTNEYKARPTGQCFFCPLKKAGCPIYNKTVETVVSLDDI